MGGMGRPDNRLHLWGSDDYVAQVKVCVDGVKKETSVLPVNNLHRRLELWHSYDMEDTTHRLELEWLNPTEDLKIKVSSVITYTRP